MQRATQKLDQLVRDTRWEPKLISVTRRILGTSEIASSLSDDDSGKLGCFLSFLKKFKMSPNWFSWFFKTISTKRAGGTTEACRVELQNDCRIWY